MKQISLYTATLSILWMAFAFLPQEKLGWRMDKKYSVRFSSPSVAGEFTSFRGEVQFDTTNLSGCSFVLNVDPASVNTGNAMQNGHIQKKEWLDSKSYSSISFISSTFTKEAGAYSVLGKMTMHGVTREIAIPFTYMENKNKADIRANFSINRFDYGVGSPKDGVDSILAIQVVMPLKRN